MKIKRGEEEFGGRKVGAWGFNMDGKVWESLLSTIVVSGEESKKEREGGGGGRGGGRREKQWLIVPCNLKNATSIKKMLHQHVVTH